jgi:multiple sugar transport system permease protein
MEQTAKINVTKKRRMLTNKQQLKVFQLAMLLPALSVLVIINFVPIINTFITSLQDYFLPAPDATQFVGLGNYIELFQDVRFINSLRLTLIYTFSVVVLETILGFLIALLLSRQTWGSNFVRGILLLPIILTPITIAFMWRVMFSPTIGILNYFLGLLNLPGQMWIYSPEQALPSLFLVDIWQKTPTMPYQMKFCKPV